MEWGQNVLPPPIIFKIKNAIFAYFLGSNFAPHAKNLRRSSIILVIGIRDHKVSPKARPELRPAPPKIWRAQYRARLASLGHRTKPDRQYIMRCDCFLQVGRKQDTFSSGSTVSPTGLEFCAQPVHHAKGLYL